MTEEPCWWPAETCNRHAEIEQLRASIAYMRDHAWSPTIIIREAYRALGPKPPREIGWLAAALGRRFHVIPGTNIPDSETPSY